MAAAIPIPGIATLADSTDFTLTVSPYLSQLSPAHVLQLLRGEVTARTWYLSTNPLITAVLLAAAATVIAFFLAEATRNYSQIDRLWSPLPAVYVVHFVVWGRLQGVGSERLETAATLVVLWSIRLTFNYYRRGGYSAGSEDYRWSIVRAYIDSPILFMVFNLTFISIFQSVLLLSLITPLYPFLLISSPVTLVDTIFSRGLVVVVLLEGLADQQQWNYQQAKRQFLSTGEVAQGFAKEDLQRGFVVTGLWSLCRHPNFACEQLLWFGVYQWSCFVTNTMWNWTGLGVAALWAVFQGSTWLTELVSAGKYPEYKEYQALVNRFVPGWETFFVRSEEGEKKKV